MGTEIWKPAPGFDKYEVSNKGRIRNRAGELMKLSSNGRGYFIFRRMINGKPQKDYVHRLVALAFLPNPENKACINHLDCNPANNNVNNLEWCTVAENMEYMRKLGRNKRTSIWIERLHESQKRFYKSVVATSIKTGEELHFDYINEVRSYGFQPSCVCNCCNNKRLQHKGYRWRYEEEQVNR